MVALKFLSPHLARHAHDLERFTREAKVAAALNHPNICTVHEIGQHDGQSFIALELLEGRTLQHVLDGQPLPMATVVTYAAEMASALSAAHAKGVVHRDIKPGNLFVTALGPVKVLDFGLAKLASSDDEPGVDPTRRPSCAKSTAPRPARCWAPWPTCRPSRPWGKSWTPAPTSTRWASCSTRWPRARCPSRAPRRRPSSARSCTTSPTRRPSGTPRCRPISTASSTKALEKDVALRYQTADDVRVDLARLARESDTIETTAFRPEPCGLPGASPQARRDHAAPMP